MTKEEIKKRKIDFLALQVLYDMEKTRCSPCNVRMGCRLVRTLDGNDITVKTAYLRVRQNVNYVDSEIVAKINNQSCVVKPLKKDCNK